MPWVVLGITLAVGLLVTVVYTFVMYIIDGFMLNAVLWLIFGLIWVGEYFDGSMRFNSLYNILHSKIIRYFYYILQSFTSTCGSLCTATLPKSEKKHNAVDTTSSHTGDRPLIQESTNTFSRSQIQYN